MPLSPSFGGSNAASIADSNIGCRVRHTSNQDITADTDTVMEFDAETFDNDSMHDPCGLDQRITINTPGKYLFFITILWQQETSGSREVQFRLNGACGDIVAASKEQFITSVGNRQNLSVVWDCISGDYMEVIVYQDSACCIDLFVSQQSEWASRFAAALISL